MPQCSICGSQHELLDPTFLRPEYFVRLEAADRESYSKASDDICSVALPNTAPRYFVRGTLPVEVAGYPDGLWWGVWAEVAEQAFSRILELWSDPDQASDPPIFGQLANVIPDYPDTLGLPVSVQLTGPTSRPELSFTPEASHPFVSECVAGVDAHKAFEWSSRQVST